MTFYFVVGTVKVEKKNLNLYGNVKVGHLDSGSTNFWEGQNIEKILRVQNPLDFDLKCFKA